MLLVKQLPWSGHCSFLLQLQLSDLCSLLFCNLCLEEKHCIMKARLKNLLNKRSEIILKCRHWNRSLISKTNHAKTIAMSHRNPANHDINKQGKRRQWIDAVSVAWRSHPRETRSSNHKLLSEITLHLSSAPHGIEHSWIYRKHYHFSYIHIYIYIYKHHEKTLLKYVSGYCLFLSPNILQKGCPYINSTWIYITMTSRQLQKV